MLKYNINRVCRLSGIARPVPFLESIGIPRSIASRIINDKVSIIQLKHIEKMCLKFKCTPNDLMEWTPDKSELLKNDQPLTKLISGTSAVLDMRSLCSDIPFEKLPLFAEKIKEMKNDLVSGK